MNNIVNSYRDLLVWQKSMDLVVDTYKAVSAFPKEEIYGLTSQIKRAVVSVPSNIAEGSSRRSKQEFMRFINIAKGSLAELETQFIVALRLNFIKEDILKTILSKSDEIGRMMQGLYSSLEKKTKL